MAIGVARRIATNAVNAIAAQTLGSTETRRTENLFADTHAVALAAAHTQVYRRVVGASGGEITADTGVTGNVARLARRIACGFATNAIGAEIAQTGVIRCARLSILIVAVIGSVTRLSGSRTTRIVLPLRHVRTGSKFSSHVAGPAQSRARRIATNAIDAVGAHAFGTTSAGFSERFLACFIAIARIVHADATRRIDGGRRIRWIALVAAQILRARIVIHRNVALLHGRLYRPHSVALENFAITGRLSGGQIRTIGGIRKAADVVNACARLAKIIYARTLSRRRAPDTTARAVTYLARSATEIFNFRRIRRYTVRANIFRARISVNG